MNVSKVLNRAKKLGTKLMQFLDAKFVSNSVSSLLTATDHSKQSNENMRDPRRDLQVRKVKEGSEK